MRPVPFSEVLIDDSFWTPRIETNRKATIPLGYEQCRRTGRIAAWKLDWSEGDPGKPHIFWDSDVAKWMEAAACSLSFHPDAGLEKMLEDIIDMMEKAQQPDGYLNSYFTSVEPENRWSNLRDRHELYCAGHLIEAAVAYHSATGDRRFLDIVRKYADCIDSVFGPEENRIQGYPGHEEIELALVKLFRATGEQRYLELAAFFLNTRGTQPHYYDRESIQRGEKPVKCYEYWQAHLPVRKQKTAVGHAVRAMYLYSGMADLAEETNDEDLAAACRLLWKNITERRMYVTGGLGSTEHGESFTTDYDLPNETAYAETCAAIGLVFWAHRMLHLDRDAVYADVMEKALYNGVLSGVSLEGTRFFYTNPLEVRPGHHSARTGVEDNFRYSRSEWFNCSCCPTNIMRLLSSFGQYIYSSCREGIYVHLFAGGKVGTEVSGIPVTLRQETGYPWTETTVFHIEPEKQVEFTLFLRIPGWCRNASISLNGKNIGNRLRTEKGYTRIHRTWNSGDTVELILPMPVEEIEAHPDILNNCGRVALQRGPIVYCLEEQDNCPDLQDLQLDSDPGMKAEFNESIQGGCVIITGTAHRRKQDGWAGQLYRSCVSETEQVRITAVPYCLWNNRKPGGMIVWIGRNR